MKNIQNLPFDMKSTLDAIKASEKVKDLFMGLTLKELSDESLVKSILFIANLTKDDLITISELDKQIKLIHFLMRLIPENTIKRNHLHDITLLDTHWFRKGSNYDNLHDVELFPNGPITTNVDEAASLYSLPWGMASVIDGNPYQNSLTMYMTVEEYAVKMLDIYFAYTFFHEIGHVYSNSVYYANYYAKKFLGITNITEQRATYMLTLPNGTKISGDEYFDSFASLIEQYGPFGTYTAGYSRANDESLWLRESFADASAAYFLGFMMYPEKDFDSLHPDVMKYMHDFYHAVATITKH